MGYLLVVLFLINGEYQFAEGYYPLITDSDMACEQRRQNMAAYFEANQDKLPPYKLACYKALVPGVSS